jgi:hypothetical protein
MNQAERRRRQRTGQPVAVLDQVLAHICTPHLVDGSDAQAREAVC